MNGIRRLGRQALRVRGFIASLAALLLAWRGQAAYDAQDLGGVRLYLLACAILIVGYLFTYKNHAFFRNGEYELPTTEDDVIAAPPVTDEAAPTTDNAPTAILPVSDAAAPIVPPSPATTLRVRRATPNAEATTPVTTLRVRRTRLAAEPPTTTLRVRRRVSVVEASSPPASLPLSSLSDNPLTLTPPAVRGKMIRAAQLKTKNTKLIIIVPALLLNVIALILHEPNPLNVFAILLWAISLALFALAFTKQQHGIWPISAVNPDETESGEDDGVIARPGIQSNRRLEYILLGIILLAALGARAYGLSYSAIGIHSDEGEIGVVARELLRGNFAAAPPLVSSQWYYYPSAAMWTMLPGMILLANDTPAGIHFSGAIFSVLDIFAVFLLVRLLWGSRPALIAAALMAGAPTLLHFSLYPAATEQMGLFWALAFYFFFKGLRSKRYLDFVWAGFAAAASLYFYPSSRAIAALFAILIVYLAVTRLRFLGNYWRQLGVFVLSGWLLAAPMLIYTFYHQEVLFKRLNEVSIFTQYGSSLAFGDWKVGYDIGNGPITPQTVLAHRQPWLQVLAEQAKHTYLSLNFYDDRTYFYETGKPFLPTLPAMLAVLGIAYCLWRWRDPRYTLLTIWFWVGLFLSTVITTHPPELLRMAGIVQTFYIFIAIALNKILYEIERTGWLDPREFRRWPEQQIAGLRSGVAAGRLRVRAARTTAFHLVAPATLISRPRFTNITAGLLIALLATQGVQQYYDGFRDTVKQWADLSIDGYYLQGAQQNYYVYYAGGQGATLNFVNIRFLAPNLQGEDIQRPIDVLPFHQLLPKDALFMLQPNYFAAGGVIPSIYPGALHSSIPYIDGQLYREVYIVRASEANAMHGTRVGYYAGGNVYQLGNPLMVRQERSAGLDASNPPPANLSYPAVGVWEGSVYAAQSGSYTLKIEGGTGLLVFDQHTVLRVKAGQDSGAAQALLSRGWHSFSMRVALLSASQQVHLGMVAAKTTEQPIPFEHLFPVSLNNINAGTSGPPASNNPLPAPPVNATRVQPVQIINTGLDNSATNAVAVDDNGNIFVGTDGPPHVYKYDKSGGLVKDWAVLPNQPGQDKSKLTDITVDHKGQVYVLDPVTKNLEVYDNNGKLIGHRNAANKFGAYGPQGLATDKQGNLYIADTGGSRILARDSQDNLVREIGGGNRYPVQGNPPKPDPRRTYQPIDVTVTDDGSIYTVDLNQRIIKYGPDGKYVSEWQIPSLGGGTASMHLASYKNLVYLSNTNTQSVFLLNTQGDGSVVSFGGGGTDPGSFDNPAGLATDAAGHLYVADRNNHRVQVFDLGGK